MKKQIAVSVIFLLIMTSSLAFSAYHHMGEEDSDKFLVVYPDKAGTKLDHCALCHSGGQYVNSKGKTVTLGSCQWCHDTYGYDESGNIQDTLNNYAKDYQYNGRDEAAIRQIETLDSDNDGYTNIDEIKADNYPGNDNDDPTKIPAPSIVFTKTDLEAMTQHTQFLLMNTSRSGDFYAEYKGVPMEELLNNAGILNYATGITVYAPDGWSNYHPLESDANEPELYHALGTYPAASYQYNAEADVASNGWCDYSAPSCVGRNHNDPIAVSGGLKTILAIWRDNTYLTPGILTDENKLDGEGPYRLVVPQKNPSPPDQSSTSDNQNVVWPYNYDGDHNAGSCSRSVTIIKVEPLPSGTTDIDIMEAGWRYVDDEKIIIYGAIDGQREKIANISSENDGSSDSSDNSNCFINLLF